MKDKNENKKDTRGPIAKFFRRPIQDEDSNQEFSQDQNYESPSYKDTKNKKFENIKDRTYFEWLEYKYTWLANKGNRLSDWAYDYLLPNYFKTTEIVGEQDREALEFEKKKTFALKHLQGKMATREGIIHTNHKNDVKKVKSKEQLCKTWGENEVTYLELKKKYLNGIVPDIEQDLDQIPDWNVKEGDSFYRGTSDLCETLRCTDPLQNTRAITDTIEKCQTNKMKLAHTIRQVTDLQNKILEMDTSLLECKASLAEQWTIKQNHYITNNNPPLELGPSNSLPQSQLLQHGYQQDAQFYNQRQLPIVPNNYHTNEELTQEQRQRNFIHHRQPLNSYDNLVFRGRTGTETFIKTLTFPLTICDKRSPVWKGKAPLFPLRITLSFITAYLWVIVILLAARILNYIVDCLPNPKSIKITISEEEDKKAEEINQESAPPKGFFGILANVIKIKRGGHINPLSTSNEVMDDLDIMILTHIYIQRERSNMLLAKRNNPFTRFKRRLRVFIPKWKLNPSIVGYLALSLLTLNEVSIPNGREHVSYSKVYHEPYIDVKAEEIIHFSREVRLGSSSIISFEGGNVKTSQDLMKVDEQVKEVSPRVKYEFNLSSRNRRYRLRKGAKVMRFTDLTPIKNADTYSSHEYYNSNQNYCQQSSPIRIQN